MIRFDEKVMVSISCGDCKQTNAIAESDTRSVGDLRRSLIEAMERAGWGNCGGDFFSCPRCMGYEHNVMYTLATPPKRSIGGTFTHWVDMGYGAIYRGISRIYEEGDMGRSLWGMVGVLFGVLLMLGTKDHIDNWDILASGIVGGWFATFILGAYRAIRRL